MPDLALIIANAIRKYALALIAGAMVVAFALSWGLPRLEFKTGQDTLINPSSTIAQDNARFQAEFGGEPMLLLFEVDPGADEDIRALFEPENRGSLERLTAALNDSGNFHSVISPLLILELAQTQIATLMVEAPQALSRDQDAAEAEARSNAIAAGHTLEQQDAAGAAARDRIADAFDEQYGADARRFLALDDQTLDNPEYVEFVLFGADGAVRPELAAIFPDEHHALMIARLTGNLSLDDGSRLAGEMVELADGYQFDGVTLRVSGPPLLIKEINDEMRSSLVVMAIFVVAIMAAVLFVVFRARWRLLSLPAVLVGSVSAFGLMGFLGIPFTMVTISGLPILIGLGVDFAIQVHSRIEEETLAADSADAGIERMLRHAGPPLLLAAIAACIGFLVLHLSEVPMIREFGSMLAVGSLLVFVTSTTLVASIVFLRERVRIGERTAGRSRFEVERLVDGLTSSTTGRLAPIAAVAIIVALGGLYVSGKISTVTDPERFVPAGSDVLRDLHAVRDVTGSTSELNILIETSGDVRATDQAVLDWLAAFQGEQGERYAEHLGASNSIASLTTSLNRSAPTTAAAADTITRAPAPLVDSVINDDGTMASITFAIQGEQSLEERTRMMEAMIDDADPPPGVTVAPAGLAVIGAASLDAMSANRELMSFVALGAILVVLLVWYRDPVKAILPLLPVVLALGASALLLYAAGISYSPLTSISGPLIIAMGTEFNILLMSRYYEERAAGRAARDAMSTASLRIGRAIAASGLTVLGGFAVLAFSDFPLLDNFGKVTTLNIGVSLISTLVLLPPLLFWVDAARDYTAAPADALPE